jgi:hypothetical protein
MSTGKEAIYAAEEQITENTPGIVNKEAFRKWKAWKKHPILKQRIITTSEGVEIDIVILWHYFRKRIEHLPEEEREELIARKKKYTHVINTINGLKGAMYAAWGRSKQYKGILDSRREDIIELFGRMFTIHEVHKTIVEDWGIPASLQAVEKFRAAHINTIVEKIEEFKRSYSDIRLGVKRSRLEELTWLYVQTKEKFKMNKGMNEHRQLLATIDAIRKEVEGDKLVIEGGLELNIENTVNVHLKKEVLKSLNIYQIILARVAMRARISPMILVNNLLNSFYSKHFGIVAKPTVNYDELTYPSIQPYDFNMIENAVVIEEQNTQLQERKIESHEQAIVNEKRKELAEKIKKKVLDKKSSLVSKQLDIEHALANVPLKKRDNPKKGE